VAWRKKQKPKKSNVLGPGWLFSVGGQVGIVPELVARQAQGIIMGEAPVLKLNVRVQFGTSFASFKLFYE